MNRSYPLKAERYCNHHCPHDLILLEVVARAIWMGVVTSDTGLRYCPVGINGLQIGVWPIHDHFGIRPIGTIDDCRQSAELGFVLGLILLVNRPKTYQLVANPILAFVFTAKRADSFKNWAGRGSVFSVCQFSDATTTPFSCIRFTTCTV